MSEEEIIKNIEHYLSESAVNEKDSDFFKNGGWEIIDLEIAEAIQGLLDLYNKEKLNTLNLSEQLNKEKEKEKNKPKLLYNAKTDTFTSIKALDNNFIEKSKIKDLINKRGNNGYTSLDCIDDIEKLLEE